LGGVRKNRKLQLESKKKMKSEQLTELILSQKSFTIVYLDSVIIPYEQREITVKRAWYELINFLPILIFHFEDKGREWCKIIKQDNICSFLDTILLKSK